jgi:hypothetical protein
MRRRNGRKFARTGGSYISFRMGSLDLDTCAGMTPGIILSAIEVLRLTVFVNFGF